MPTFSILHHRILANSLIVAALLSGCVPLPISEHVNVVSVSGTVVSSNGQRPIPHARVEVTVRCDDTYLREIPESERVVGFTDDQGQFMLHSSGTRSEWLKFPLLPPFPGEHRWSSAIEVVVNAQGFETLSRSEAQKGMMMSARPDYCRGSYQLGALELTPSRKGR